jgi:hypothetical protein
MLMPARGDASVLDAAGEPLSVPLQTRCIGIGIGIR